MKEKKEKKKSQQQDFCMIFQRFEKNMAFLTFDNMICSGNASKAGRGIPEITKTSM